MSNRVFIRTDKPAYVGGDTVTGSICVSVARPIPAKSISLKVKGFEKTSWKERHTEMIPNSEPPQFREVFYDREGKNEFFRDKVVIFESSMVELPVGQWAYPFSWTLPNDLPGVFHFHGSDFGLSYRNVEAKIVYKVKAVVDVPSSVSSDLKSTQTLTIHTRLGNDVKPVSGHKTGKVLLCCCIPRGDVHLTAHFDSNSYQPGQTAKIFAQVKNDSKSNVNHMVVKLMRRLSFHSKDGHTVSRQEEIYRNTYEGCPALSSRDREVPLNLPADVMPGTKSRLVECRYWAQVECDIPFAPDIEVHMPLVLFAPQPRQWGTPGMDAIHFQPFSH